MRMLLIVLLYVFFTTSCGDDFEFIPVEVLNNKDQGEVDSLDISPAINGNGEIDIKVDSTINEYEFVIHI